MKTEGFFFERSRVRRLGIVGATFVALLIGAGCSTTGAREVLLPGHRVFPESITSTRDGRLYVSNLGEGGVLRITDARVERWIAPGAFGTRSIFGVFADEASQTLWTCSSDASKYGLTEVGDPGSALKGFDLRTGEGKVSAALGPGEAGCNDIAVDAAGNVYVTDTYQPRIFRLDKGKNELRLWASDPRFQHKDGGLDGIAFDSAGNLYVNTYGGSYLFRIDVVNGEAGQITQLTPSHPVEGADGMRSVGGNRFLMVDGSGTLNLVTMNSDRAELTAVARDLKEPTSVTLVNGTAWVTEGQLSGIERPDSKLKFRVLAVPFSGVER